MAAQERLRELGCSSPRKQLHGIELRKWRARKEERQFLESLGRRLTYRDSFSLSARSEDAKFDVVLANPPYVRHHALRSAYVQRIRRLASIPDDLPLTANLWAYSILHTFSFLREGGVLGAVLPWSLLYADFARPVRKALQEAFRKLDVLVIGERPFGSVEERALLLIGREFGSAARSVRVAYSPHVPARFTAARRIPVAAWDAGPWPHVGEATVPDSGRASESGVAGGLGSVARDDLGFVELGSVARVLIGTVTGANGFFVMSRGDARERGIPESYLKPVLRGAGELASLQAGRRSGLGGRMLVIPASGKLPRRLRNYILSGERRRIHKRHHTGKREKWYCIPEPVSPSAFMQYMVKETPFIRTNPDGFLSTNNLHQITFDADVGEAARGWIELSSYSSVFQWSAEVEGRTYGGGVLKLEPGRAKELLVYTGAGKNLPKRALSRALALVEKGERAQAVAVADAAIQKATGASPEVMSAFSECHRGLRDRRIGP